MIERLAVVGAGTMGHGIAHVAATSGISVVLIDLRRDLLDKALASISKNMDRQIAKGLLSQEKKTEALGRLSVDQSLEAAQSAGIVVEAVPESLALKTEIFRKLDGLCAPGTILASNTSSLPIANLASATSRPDKVIGMHFMNPVPVMKLVEIIRGSRTSEETAQTVRDLALRMGKTPACSKDSPGFISNRILMPMINEAAFALMEGVASREDIDTVMKLGMNHPMGPLTLADAIGLDVCLAVMETLHEGFKDPKYRPCPLFGEMIGAGRLGRKSGSGFYDY